MKGPSFLFAAWLAVVGLALGSACSRKDAAPGTAPPPQASSPATVPTGSGSATALSPAAAPSGGLSDLPPAPRDEAFESFGDGQLKYCKLGGDPGGTTVDMAQHAASTQRCFVNRASRIVAAMPSAQRREVLAGVAPVPANAWYEDWALFAALTTELNVRMSFTSGSTHTGGTILIVLRPARASGVAQEVLYLLHSVTEGDVNAFATRVKTLTRRGRLIAPSLAELEAQATRYLRQVPETAIPEYYPTHMSPLYGGDWRRVVYDVRQLRQMVPGLARRICRSSRALTAKFAEMEGCISTVGEYLYAQIGAVWSNEDEDGDQDSVQTDMPPGIDAAYYPVASATYESCEVDVRGQRVQYKKRVQCLKDVLDRSSESSAKVATASKAVADSTRGYLAAQCALEVAPGLELDLLMGRPFLSADECQAVGAVRARYFLDTWNSGQTAGLRNHLRARAAWGDRVRQRLPLLTARHEAALRAPKLPPDDDTWSTASRAEHQKALEAIKSTAERARLLASQLCAGSSPAASALGTDCVKALTGYWLSYAYVPGMRWEGE